MKREEDAVTSLAVANARAELREANRLTAAEVKKCGYTRTHQDLAEAADQVGRETVCLRRQEGRERMARVGPAGGALGAAAARACADAQRGPLPLTSVVSTADAKVRHGMRLARGSGGTARSGKSGGGRGGTGGLGFVGGGGGSVVRKERCAGELGGDDAGLMSARTWASEHDDMSMDGSSSGGGMANQTLPDLLPEMPHAIGASMTISQRNRPIGIVP